MNWRNKIIVSPFTDFFRKERYSSNFKIFQWTLTVSSKLSFSWWLRRATDYWRQTLHGMVRRKNWINMIVQMVKLPVLILICTFSLSSFSLSHGQSGLRLLFKKNQNNKRHVRKIDTIAPCPIYSKNLLLIYKLPASGLQLFLQGVAY